MPEISLRPMRPADWPMVAELICDSIRRWYDAAGRPGRFPNGPASCMVFPEVYEDLDPGCCIVAEDTSTGRLAGSCFYHPREAHISIGIMNAHPDYFRHGVAKRLLAFVCDLADRTGKPLRLYSSAMNIDSFSLYTRAGFVPRDVFQVMSISVPAGGMNVEFSSALRTRPATLDDVDAMANLERDISGIRRARDYQYFIENRRGIWHATIAESRSGEMEGFLISISHPGSTMIGPGVMRTDEAAAVCMLAELNHLRGQSPACLVPAARPALIQQLYRWGLRNSELALFQCRGKAQAFNGVALASFMPETG